MKLIDLISTVSLEDVELYHSEEEFEEENATITNLELSLFSEAGKEHYKDVLNADIESMRGGNGEVIHIFLSGVEAEKISRLSMDMAGYIDEEHYELYFPVIDKDAEVER